MLIKNIISFLLILVVSLSTFAIAEENSEENNDLSKPYLITVMIGDSNADFNAVSKSFSNLSFGGEFTYFFKPQYGVKFGGMSSNDLFPGLFGSQSYYADSKYLAFTANTQSNGLFGFGSLGYAKTDETLEDPVTCALLVFCLNEPVAHTSSSGLYWEIGTGWNLGSRFEMALSYSQISAEMADLSNTYLKMSYRF
ncbi:MAG: hypothetical protein OEY19_01140 [Gammaproteobacteria bacterium]|nr:hypothetical protein [Gammaproteobacteria bacterium]MDH5628673.1 hypothetical protein [Gammaproteobacteria bacterium]